jgi:hypothetical protein
MDAESQVSDIEGWTAIPTRRPYRAILAMHRYDPLFTE